MLYETPSKENEQIFNNLSHKASIPAPKKVLAFKLLARKPSIKSVAKSIIVTSEPKGAPLIAKIKGKQNAPINLVQVIKLIMIILIKSFFILIFYENNNKLSTN